MRTTSRQWFLVFINSFFLLLAAIPAAYASEMAGKIISIKGSVTAVSTNGSKRILSSNSPIYAGDDIITSANSHAQVLFSDNSITTVIPNSNFRINNYHYSNQAKEDSFVVTLVKGAFRTITGSIGKNDPDKYIAKSAISTIGIRGTFFGTELNEEGQVVCVKRGAINVGTQVAKIPLGQGTRYDFAVMKSPTRPPQASSESPEFLFNQFTRHLYGHNSNVSNRYRGVIMPVLPIDQYYESNAYLYVDYPTRANLPKK